MMKMTRKKAAGIGLIVFFFLAVIMTIISQKNYNNSRIKVSVQENAGEERLKLKRIITTELHTDFMGFGTFQWEFGTLAQSISTQDELVVYDEDYHVYKSRIIDKQVSEDGKCQLWIHMDGNIYMDGTYTIVLNFQGPLREYVYPIEAVNGELNGQEAAIFVVYTREKIFGTEYYVKEEDVMLYEYNEEKMALQNDTGGPVVLQSEVPLHDGDRVIFPLNEEKE